ncbi:MAG: Lrp/AsnC family transcriptional regulator [Chitinophagaceae bacterium]|nr:Lrp/AsnC family transcriptional regulator [Chitinophagaceae bacterium]
MENLIFDTTDIRILQLLQHDARLTNKEIADKTGKSVTPVYERIKRLEAEGVIEGYKALLNKDKIGRALIAYTNVQLKEHSKPMLRDFEKAIVQIEEVMECMHLTGTYDYLLKVAVADIHAYHDFLTNKLAALPNIGTVQSGFVMNEVKRSLAYPLSAGK